MSDNPELASLTRWLGELQREVRGLATGNPLNYGTVEGLNGQQVRLSSLAFGQTAAVLEGENAVLIPGTNVAMVEGAETAYQFLGPNIPEVLVRSGRLRVDWAAMLYAQGTRGAMQMSYQLRYLGPIDAKGTENTLVTPADTYRSIYLRAPTDGTSIRGSYGSFYLHEGLPPGWYLVRPAYFFSWAPKDPAVTVTPLGAADFPRIGVTPL